MYLVLIRVCNLRFIDTILDSLWFPLIEIIYCFVTFDNESLIQTSIASY